MSQEKGEEEAYDVIVIGTGVAGISAALSAAESAAAFGQRCRILVVERGNEENWGGNSRWTTANFRMLDEQHLYPSFEEDIIRDTKGKADAEYVHKLAVEAPDAINWIRSKGVKLESRPDNWTFAGFKMGPVGGGLEIITALRSHAESAGVSIMFETTAFKLLQDEKGVINGLLVRDRKGTTRKLTLSAIVLAGGGFEGNYEMLTRYFGREADSFRMDVPATKLHMGECITMALEVGASPSGEFGSYHGDVVDLRSNSYRPSIRAYIYGIIVNTRGERFVDEGMDEMSNSFEFVARSIFNEPDHKAFLIFDHRARKIQDFEKSIKSPVPPLEANSLEELAKMIHVPSARLKRTVDRYNNSVQPGLFDPKGLDGKRTEGISPPKSNWAVEIDEAPFYCYPIEGTMQFTWGGVASDSRGRVLATNGAPIPGLYAAGEVVGFYHHHYTPGTSVLRALTFGRIAGFEAVRWIFNE